MATDLLDFTGSECGYKHLDKSKESFKANIGKRICWVDHIDPHRGYYRVEYGTITAVRYSQLYLDDWNKQVDIRDIKQCGIKIEQ